MSTSSERCQCGRAVLLTDAAIKGLRGATMFRRGDYGMIRDELEVFLGDLEEHCGLPRPDVMDIRQMVDNGDHLGATAMLRGSVARCIGQRARV